MKPSRKGLVLAAACVVVPLASVGWASASSPHHASHVADEGVTVLPGTLTNNGGMPVWVEYAGPGGANLQPGDHTDKAGAWLVGPRTSCSWLTEGATRPTVTTNSGLGNIWVTSGGYTETVTGCSPTQ